MKIIGIACAVLLCCLPTAFAATFNVSSTAEFRQALKNAAINEQDDTIILADGTYKTNDDGDGTFTFLGNEAYSLVIEGSSSENVILSGNLNSQIFKYMSTNYNANLYLTNLSFIDGYTNNDGAGVYSNQEVVIRSCNFSNNKADGIGAGLSAVYRKVTVINSKFTNNFSASNGGGFFATDSVVNSSIFINNTGWAGGGFCSTGSANVNNSIFFENNATSHGAGFACNNIVMTNCLLSKNTDAVSIANSTNSKIINSTFIENISDIYGPNDGLITLQNNYINPSKINVTFISNNNIFDGINLDFVDYDNNDYRLKSTSDFIDTGLSTDTFNDVPTTDFDGNQRISGGNIDIGPYEFSSTRPIINSFTHTGTDKIYQTITFSVDATATPNRSIAKYEIDFGDGIYTEATTNVEHIFDTPGVYNITVKVTDSEDEFSTRTLSINIADLSNAEKLAAEFERGNQFVIDNHSQFGFVTTAELNSAILAERNKWDANGDGKIGLEEAINALKISAGEL